MISRTAFLLGLFFLCGSAFSADPFFAYGTQPLLGYISGVTANFTVIPVLMDLVSPMFVAGGTLAGGAPSQYLFWANTREVWYSALHRRETHLVYKMATDITDIDVLENKVLFVFTERVLHIVDVTTPSNPKLLNITTLPSYKPGVRGVAMDRNTILYVDNTDKKLYIWNYLDGILDSYYQPCSSSSQVQYIAKQGLAAILCGTPSTYQVAIGVPRNMQQTAFTTAWTAVTTTAMAFTRNTAYLAGKSGLSYYDAPQVKWIVASREVFFDFAVVI